MKKLEYRGLKIVVEFDKGDRRPWRDDAGKKQFTTMGAPYGYVDGTKGVDGDDVDVYVGPDESSDSVFVVRQMKKGAWETFDEEKCILGVGTPAEAKSLYLAHYNDPRFFGGIKELSFEKFVDRLATRGQQGKKLAEKKDTQALVRDFYVAQAKVDHKSKPTSASLVAALGGEKVSSNRKQLISDRIDDAGLAVLASPYIASAIGNRLAGRPGRLGVIGAAANAYKKKFEGMPLAEVAGLALVAPGITHNIAKGVDKLTTKRAQLEEAQKVAFVGALRSLAAPAAAGIKNIVQRGGRSLGAGVSASAPAATPTVATTAKKLMSGANIAKAGLLGGAGLAMYAGKKTIDGAASLASAHTESMAPAAYQAPRVI